MLKVNAFSVYILPRSCYNYSDKSLKNSVKKNLLGIFPNVIQLSNHMGDIIMNHLNIRIIHRDGSLYIVKKTSNQNKLFTENLLNLYLI